MDETCRLEKDTRSEGIWSIGPIFARKTAHNGGMLLQEDNLIYVRISPIIIIQHSPPYSILSPSRPFLPPQIYLSQAPCAKSM